MYCKQCGKEIPDGSKFCKFCGKDLLIVSEAGKSETRNQAPDTPGHGLVYGNEQEVNSCSKISEISEDKANEYSTTQPKRSLHVSKKLGIGIVVVVAVIIIGSIIAVQNGGVIADAKSLVFDGISDIEFGHAVEMSLDNTEWSYERVEDNHYEVVVTGFSPELVCKLRVVLQVYYGDDGAYGRVSAVSDEEDTYVDDESISAVMYIIYGSYAHGMSSSFDDILFETELYSLTLPADWSGRVVTEQWETEGYGYGVAFCEQKSYDDEYGGMLFSISLMHEYPDFPESRCLGELDVVRLANYYVIVSFPSDVQYSDAGMDNYIDMSEDIENVLATFTPLPTVDCTFTPYE